MHPITLSALVATATLANAQTTFTGCHMDGFVSYCYDSNGVELAMTTLTEAVLASSTPASVAASTTTEAQTTVITSCHLHETAIYCIDGHGDEVLVSSTGTPTGQPPAQYTDCHSHDSEQYCVDPEGNDVAVMEMTTTESGHDHSDGHEEGTSEGEMDCHFHAGVEHCVPVGQSESSSASTSTCQAPSARDYNVGLRIGSLFIILATSSIAVFSPLFLHKLPFGRINNIIFTAIKQFGTGIIISTAFVHLYTHAYLMFTSDCLTGVDYEATTSAVVMAGLMIAFLIEYIGYRFITSRQQRTKSENYRENSASNRPSSNSSEDTPVTSNSPDSKHEDPQTNSTALQNISHSHSPTPFNPNTLLAVSVMEAGILFHSVLIGLTLVVAPDNSSTASGYYNTLLAVIIFHQFFEGLALGARIALLPTSSLHLGIWSKIIMAAAFALITPLGMAIGIGVLNEFNGNDQGTILVIGVFDALSAGVLLWVGLVDMWGRDWAMAGGEMVGAGVGRSVVGLGNLVVGMVVMSLLGKWA